MRQTTLVYPTINSPFWWIEVAVLDETIKYSHVCCFRFVAKPTERQIRKVKKEAYQVHGLRMLKEDQRHDPNAPEGYEMSGKDGWGAGHYQAFIDIGWQPSTMIACGYLRPIVAV